MLRPWQGLRELAMGPALAERGGLWRVPSLRPLALPAMVTTALRYAPEDPFSLLESCQRALEWMLYKHRHQPIPRCWIDHPYGEEEITLLEEELMPVLSKLLRRIEEIDTELEALQKAHEALLQASVQPAQPLPVSHP